MVIVLSAAARRNAGAIRTPGSPPHRGCGVTTTLLLLLFLLLTLLPTCQGIGIPGTQATVNGYDTELGTDAICWESASVDNSSAIARSRAILFPNPLLRKFVVSDKGIQIRHACPVGNNMTGEAPNLVSAPTVREYYEDRVLRTHEVYNYSVTVRLNMTSLGATEFLADDRVGLVAIQVLLCVTGISGFCSPFIHEQANVRLEELKRLTGFVEVRQPGDLHGGSHVHSPYQLLELPADEGPVFERTIQVPLRVNLPGQYYAITAVHLFFRDASLNSTTILNDQGDVVDKALIKRFDMANALASTSRIVTYQDAPVLHTVPTAVVRFSYSLIGVASVLLVFCMVELVRHRRKEVLRLAQGHWLLGCCGLALVATISTVLLQPLNDAYCQISIPIILVCLQALYAILVGRIWRIHVLVSPLLKQSLQGTQQASRRNLGTNLSSKYGLVRWIRQRVVVPLEHCWERVEVSHAYIFLETMWEHVRDAVPCLSDHHSHHSRGHLNRKGSIRRHVSDQALGRIVLGLTMPQLLLQALALGWQPRTLTIELSPDATEGRYICEIPHNQHWYGLFFWGLYSLAGVVVILLYMTHQARQLPSLLNETQRIWDGTLTSGVLLILGVAVILVAGDQPSSSPGIHYLVLVTVVLCLTLNMTLRMVGPPLHVIYQGETILVSQLVQDHALQAKQRSQRKENSSRIHVSGFEHTGMNSSYHRSRVSGMDSSQNLVDNSTAFHVESFHGEGENTSHHPMEGTVKEVRPADNDEDDDDDDLEHAKENPPTKSDGTAATTVSVRTEDAMPPVVSFMDEPSRGRAQALLQTSRFAKSTKFSNPNSRFTVYENQPPRQRLLVPMVEVQEQLNFINRRLLSGFAVSREDWEDVASATYKLGCTFHDRVEFAWKKPVPETAVFEEDNDKNKQRDAGARRPTSPNNHEQQQQQDAAPSKVVILSDHIPSETTRNQDSEIPLDLVSAENLPPVPPKQVAPTDAVGLEDNILSAAADKMLAAGAEGGSAANIFQQVDDLEQQAGQQEVPPSSSPFDDSVVSVNTQSTRGFV